MIDPAWRRIAGVHFQDDGITAVVWLAHDKDTSTVHAYDCALFRREPPVFIAECINSRGRWIPVAWEKSAKDMADALLDRGCRMLPEPISDTLAMCEVNSRKVWEWMRTSRFKIKKSLAEWLDESRTFYRQDSQVPRTGHPLMSATRHAMGQLEYARPQSTGRRKMQNFPKVAIV